MKNVWAPCAFFGGPAPGPISLLRTSRPLIDSPPSAGLHWIFPLPARYGA